MPTKLKAVIDNEADLPEALREHYHKREDGKFLLQVDGIKTDADIERQLEANKKERNEHSVTKQKVADLEAKLASLGSLGGGGATVDDIQHAVDELAAAQTAAATAKLSADAATVAQERDTARAETASLRKQIADREIGLALTDAARAARVLPGAVDTLTKLGATEFKLVDGQVVTEAGLAPAAWIESMKHTSPFLWPASKGAGAGNSVPHDAGMVHPQDNPFSAEGWNLTAQGHLSRSNPTRANELARMAGTKVGGQRPKQAA